MNLRAVCVSMCFCSCLCLSACGKASPAIKNKVPLTPVTGSVLVDGEPKAGVYIQHIPLSATAESRPEYNEMIDCSGDQGRFPGLHTYEQNDGLPAGEYGLTFMLLDNGNKSHAQLLTSEYTNRAIQEIPSGERGSA